MKSICGIKCAECFFKDECKGCTETGGCPFGEQCFIARYIKQHGAKGYAEFVDSLITEINYLAVPDMPDVESLNALKGSYVNLEYTLPSGQKVKLLNDNKIYLGNQLCKPKSDRCFGIAADEEYILICEYGENGSDPEIVVYMRR